MRQAAAQPQRIFVSPWQAKAHRGATGCRFDWSAACKKNCYGIPWRIRPYRPKVSGCKRNAAKRHAASSARAVQTPYTVAFAIARRFSASPSGILP